MLVEVAAVELEPEALLPGAARPGAGDVAELGHLRQHRVAALARAGRVEHRVVIGRRLRQAGQQRRLAQLQLPDRAREVDLRRGLDADRGRALDRPVGGGVEVLAEDLPARVALGVLDRQLRLDDLALERARRVGDAEVADELLGDRRAALDRLARFEVLQRGADDALGVDAAVFVEALVLDRDGGALQALRHALYRDGRARLFGLDDAELAAVAGVDGRVAALLDRLAGGQRGRLGGDVEHPGGDPDRGDRDQRGRAEADQEDLAAGAPPVPLATAVALRHRREGTRGGPPPRRAIPWCPRSRGCGRPLRPAAGWGSPPRSRRRGRRRCRRG